MRKPVYPRLAESLDRRKKLLQADIVAIRQSYNEGESMDSLAEQYSVTPTTIRYWVDEQYRNLMRELNRVSSLKKYHDDPESANAARLESRHYVYSVNPALSKYIYEGYKFRKQYKKRALATA